MAHYAKLGLDNIVLAVVTVDNIDCMDRQGIEKEEIGIEHLIKYHGHENWIKCSYNARGGIRINPENLQPTEEKGFRCNYPGPGWFYNSEFDIFHAPTPLDLNGETCSSWTLNISTGFWDPPISLPETTQEMLDSNQLWVWDESLYKGDNSSGWVVKQCGEEVG